ncbi:MAG: flavin reductase family protein [Pirellula sp.]|jgi:flavin reductase (DIM6/NTAB) family NADH-FMN oxidoreductase RutF|nr:flavin reductase family protein [Pirellula sp.]
MFVDVAQSPVLSVYQTLVGLVTPRPIAWVTSISDRGIVNLAPFSFFNVFGANPPIVVFSPTLKRDATKKDTLLNIEATKEYVIHASTEAHAEQINASSAPFPPEQSEVEQLQLPVLPSQYVRVPRLAEAAWALECKLLEIRSYGDGPIAANLIIGQVLAMHIDDAVLGEDGLPDPRRLKAIARLGAEYWCRTRDLFELPRPK